MVQVRALGEPRRILTDQRRAHATALRAAAFIGDAKGRMRVGPWRGSQAAKKSCVHISMIAWWRGVLDLPYKASLAVVAGSHPLLVEAIFGKIMIMLRQPQNMFTFTIATAILRWDSCRVLAFGLALA